MHANYNNIVRGGANIYTGHLHRLQMQQFSDYRGTRFGVEGGTLAERDHIHFHYTEHSPVNWQEGFAVMTFAGKEIAIELVRVCARQAIFRGKVYKA